VAENTLAATTFIALPCCIENITRTGSDAAASRKPSPWLSALASSSPKVCGRSRAKLRVMG